MNYINIKEAIQLHEDVIRESGGLNGYNKKSIGYLESALEHIQTMIYTLNLLIKYAILSLHV